MVVEQMRCEYRLLRVTEERSSYTAKCVECFARVYSYRLMAFSAHYNIVILTYLLTYLTLSPPIPLRLYTLPYWSKPPFLIFDIRALRTERQIARMSKIKNDGLDQYGAEPFEQRQFGTAGVERVKWNRTGFGLSRRLINA